MSWRDMVCVAALTALLTACVCAWTEPEPHAVVDLY